MWGLSLQWLLPLIWLGETLILTALISGVYQAYHHVFGYTNKRFFHAADPKIGLLPECLLSIGVFSLGGGLLWLTFVKVELVPQTTHWYGIGIGGFLGILYAIWKMPRRNAHFFETYLASDDSVVTACLLGLVVGGAFGGGISRNAAGGIISIFGAWALGWWMENDKKRTSPRKEPLMGEIVGSLAGGILGGIIGWLVTIVIGRTTGIVTGIIVGVIIGVIVSKNTTWLEKKVENNFAIGFFSGIFGACTVWLMFWFVRENMKQLSFTFENLGGLAIGGGILGGLLGAGIPTLIAAVILLLEHLLPAPVKGFSWIFIPVFSLLRFRSVICEYCLQRSKPPDSDYKLGIRNCEHCQKEIPKTNTHKKLIVTFGAIPPTAKKSVLRLSDPNVQSIEHLIHVTEVYIDTATCDRHVLEQFITYILNYPPKYGIKFVHIFHKGELAELGANLKNALKNTFRHISAFQKGDF